VVTALEAAGFSFKSTLVWLKNQFVLGMSDYHFRHEVILYGWLCGGAHFWNGGRSQDSVFEVDRPQVSDLHPTSKPAALIARMITNSSAFEPPSAMQELFLDDQTESGGRTPEIVLLEHTNRRAGNGSSHCER
jgi:hypothetical protein